MSSSTIAEPAGVPAPSRRSALSDRTKAERKLAFYLVAPAVIVMVAVTAYPIIDTIILSLQRASLDQPGKNTFIGLDNFGYVFKAHLFWMDLIHTAVITVVSVGIEFALGMLLALAMHRVIFARGLLRAIALVPYAIVAVVAAYAWQYSWSLDNGGWIPRLLGLSGDPLSHQFGTYVAIIMTEVWKNTPYMALLLLAGLSLVPDELLEAAKVDGASTWQRFTRITLPLMKPAILVAVAVPHARRVPDLRRDLHLQPGRQQLRVAVAAELQHAARAPQPRPRVGGLGRAVRDRRVDRRRVHQGVRRRRQPGRRDELMSVKARQRSGWSLGFIVVVVVSLVPVFWLLMLSLKTPASATDGSFIPHHWTLDNYRDIFKQSVFTAALRNSIGIGLIATTLAVLLASSAAYAIARLDFRGKQTILAVALMVTLFPQVSLVGPLYNLWRQIGLFNTWPGLIIPYLTFALPLAIYVLSTFFREIPWELEQAAQIDGATPFQAFTKVIAPLAMPGLATTFIIVFLICWNDFVFAISLTATNAAMTVPAAIAQFPGVSQFTQPIGDIAAAAIVVTVPVMVLVLLFQRRIVAGLTAGAVKG